MSLLPALSLIVEGPALLVHPHTPELEHSYVHVQVYADGYGIRLRTGKTLVQIHKFRRRAEIINTHR